LGCSGLQRYGSQPVAANACEFNRRKFQTETHRFSKNGYGFWSQAPLGDRRDAGGSELTGCLQAEKPGRAKRILVARWLKQPLHIPCPGRRLLKKD
jgi:hypothetical protein